MGVDLFDLTGKVALVTGGNSGLGYGYATGIAKAGGDLVVWGRRAARNEEAAASLREHGGRVLTQEVDVTDEQAVAAAAAEAVSEMGRLDGVIANAGISTRAPSFHQMSSDTYHELLAVNLHGAFYTLRAALEHMVERAEQGDTGGSVIVSGSLDASRGVPGIEHYAAAKGALQSMTLGLATEYGKYGIRANTVVAGYFETELGGRSPEVVESRRDQMRTRNPIARSGLPSDLEGIAVYLMSDASSYHTGDIIVIDGGMSVSIA